MRRAIFFVISLVVSVVFLWLALRDVPLDRVVESLRAADPLWIAAACLGVIGALATRAVRWRGLLDDRIPLGQAFHIFNAATLINQLPLRAGEVARAVMATRSGVPFVTAATSVVIERLLDILIIVLLIAFSLTQLPNASSSVGTTTAAVFGVAAVIGFIVLILFARYPAFAQRIAVTLETRIPLFARLKLRQRLDEILLGLRPLTHAGRAAHALVWTGIAWAFSLATFYALERALNITGVNLWLGASLSVPLVAFSIALPVSIAGLGPFQVAVNVGGAAVGMATLEAVTLGLLFHGVTVITYIVMGVIGLLTLGVGLADITRGAPKDTNEAKAVFDANG